jgi:hypothetical protein
MIADLYARLIVRAAAAFAPDSPAVSRLRECLATDPGSINVVAADDHDELAHVRIGSEVVLTLPLDRLAVEA